MSHTDPPVQPPESPQPILVPPPMSAGTEPDLPAFHRLVEENHRALCAVALRLCGNTSDANELVQETLVRALCHFSRFQRGTNGRSWLLTILRHLFISQCRARARERSHLSVNELQESIPEPEIEAPPAWADFSLEDLHAALEQLPEEFREVYRLHAFEGCSYEEISRQLRIPKATVGTRLVRARRKLREILAARGGTSS